MLLNITVNVPPDTDPASPAVLDQIQMAAAREAATWTNPVLTSTDTHDTYTTLHFQVDAVPRRGVTTTSNIAAALRPARIV